MMVHRCGLREFLHVLATEYHVRRLHCEGGGELIRSLAELDVIDQCHLTLAGHTLFGGQRAPTATGVPAEFFANSLDFRLTQFAPQPLTGECFLTYTRAS